MIEQIRIIIADDHPLFREGTRRTLSEFSDFEVVAECANGDEAVEAANEFQPDIILLDISMPGGGVNAARRITIALPEVRIVMLTVSERESDVINLMNVGATGYVSKGIAREEFAAVIKTIHEGEIYVSPSLSRDGQIPGDWLDSDEDSDLLELLTMREEQVLMKVAQGLNNRKIGLDLALNERTVKRHMTNLMRKLKVRNRVEAPLKVHTK